MAMSAGERALRLGIYCGLAAVKLRDDSYARRFVDRKIGEVSDAEYLEVTVAIQQKLVGAGVIRTDEDPFEEATKEFQEALGQAEWQELLK